MENKLEIPKEITGLDAIPVSDIIAGYNDVMDSQFSENTDANNLTLAQKILIEDVIKRNADEMSHIFSRKENDMEMWSFDDFDNAYNNGISYQEKQAYTFWIENKLGKKQQNFFKRYSLPRSKQQIANYEQLDGDGIFDSVMNLMRLGVLCYDLRSKEYCPPYIYTTGNLYRKKYDLQENKMFYVERFGEEIYNTHKTIMDNAYLKIRDVRMKVSGVGIDEVLKIDVNSDVGKDFRVEAIITPSGKRINKNFRIYKSSKGKLEFEKGKSSGKNSSVVETTFTSLTLRHAFVYWLRYSVVDREERRSGNSLAFDGMSWNRVYNQFVLGNRAGIYEFISESSETLSAYVVIEESKRVGLALWQEFLQKGITGEDKVKLEYFWNEKYNNSPNLWDESRCSYVGGNKKTAKTYELSTGGSVLMVEGKVPIGFTMAKRYGGDSTAYINDVRTDKRRSLSFNTLTNFQSLLAYGVGVGKTWCGIFQIAQCLDLGICSRPLLVLPNQVYPQFVREVKSILPQYKVNALYNLRGTFKDLANEGIEENSITIITETGLQILGFSESYVESGMLDESFDSINGINIGQPTADDEKKRSQMIAEFTKTNLKKGDDKIFVDKVKFDYVMVDEAHNYKKLVTILQGQVQDIALEEELPDDKKERKLVKEKANFEFGGGTPTGRSTKLFLITDYIQRFNKFGNTLLLTATPFTNSPLEVWSMLTYVDKNVLTRHNMIRTLDLFRVFGLIEPQVESTVSGDTKYINTFTAWKNVPALQNFIFSCIDYIPPAEVDLKRPSKVVLPMKSILNEDTREVRELERQEQISSIITMTENQTQLVNDLKAYAIESKDWTPILAKVNKIKVKGIVVGKEFIPMPERTNEFEDGYLTECEDNPDDFIACEESWNTTSLIKDESKLKWFVGTHELSKGKTFEVKEMVAVTEDEYKRIGKTFIDDMGTRVLRSLTFQRQITISPYLYVASGYKTDPTPKEYIESSSKLMYVMGCIASVKKHHSVYETPMSGQIIYMDFGISAFPLIAQYLVDELQFLPSEVGIICGQKSLTRTMDSVGKGGKSRPMDKSLVQDRFNGVEQAGDGEFLDIPDKMRVKVLIGSKTITEGMNLQMKSSVIYQCSIPFNPTDQIQLEGRVWRQGNPYKFVRIVNPLCADSIDIFMFQKMQSKAGFINQIWNRDGQNFLIDAKEFDLKELKEGCIQNPFALAEYQVEDIKADLLDQIRRKRFDKAKYDNVRTNLDKAILLQLGDIPKIVAEPKYQANKGRTNIAFGEYSSYRGAFAINSNMFRLYHFVYLMRRDLITKDLFSDTFYDYLAELKKNVDEKYPDDGWERGFDRIVTEIKVMDSDFNYTIIEILELAKQTLVETKIMPPFGFNKEAMSDVVVGDDITFIKRGTKYEGKIVEYIDDEDIFVVEVEVDGRVKEFEVDKDRNDVKKRVVVKKGSKDESNELITWGTKAFLENLPLYQKFYDGSPKKNEWIKEFIYKGAFLNNKKIDIQTMSPFFNIGDITGKGDYVFDADRWERSQIEFKGTKNVRSRLNGGFLKNTCGNNLIVFEGTYLREVERAINEFEVKMIPEGITSISDLQKKIATFDQEISELSTERNEAGSYEKLRERATMIIQERAKLNAVGDQSLREGDWESRVQDFASLNCLLDMSYETKEQSFDVVVEEAEVVEPIDAEETDDETLELKKGIENDIAELEALKDDIDDADILSEMQSDIDELKELLKEL